MDTVLALGACSSIMGSSVFSCTESQALVDYTTNDFVTCIIFSNRLYSADIFLTIEC